MTIALCLWQSRYTPARELLLLPFGFAAPPVYTDCAGAAKWPAGLGLAKNRSPRRGFRGGWTIHWPACRARR